MSVLTTPLNKLLEPWPGAQRAADVRGALSSERRVMAQAGPPPAACGQHTQLEMGAICTENTQSLCNKDGLR